MKHEKFMSEGNIPAYAFTVPFGEGKLKFTVRWITSYEQKAEYEGYHAYNFIHDGKLTNMKFWVSEHDNPTGWDIDSECDFDKNRHDGGSDYIAYADMGISSLIDDAIIEAVNFIERMELGV